ncbi:hypothetical protein BOX15_Mlig027060g2, partial [Macrostomum lignano]
RKLKKAAADAAPKVFASSSNAWHSLSCPASELNLGVTLACGQSFRWRQLEQEGYWAGVHADKVWLLRRPSEACIEFQVYPPSSSAASDQQVLEDYLRLNGPTLESLYAGWSASDPVFRSVCSQFPDVRVRLLRQQPLENLFSFICSSNNNIARISQLVEKLCKYFGQQICIVDGREYYGFPQLSALCSPEAEPRLRELGFGYRAKFVVESARRLLDLGGADWLHSLRGSAQPDEIRRCLTKEFTGVGRKVADCVCLMSLDQLHLVPVDVHVMRIARSLYGLPACTKSLTESAYQSISDFFPSLWQPHAGWAHTVLFAADLARFQHLKSPAIVDEVKPASLSTETPADAAADGEVESKKLEAERPPAKSGQGTRKRKR